MVDDALLKLELDLYRGQAEILRKRVSELELCSDSADTKGGVLKNRGNPHGFNNGSDRTNFTDNKHHLDELGKANSKICTLQSELDGLRAAKLDPDQIPNYVKDLCLQLAAERGEKQRCIRIVQDLTMSLDQGEEGGDDLLPNLGHGTSIELAQQRRIAHLSMRLKRLQSENADLQDRLRRASQDAVEAANAANELNRRLHAAQEEISLLRSKPNSIVDTSTAAGARATPHWWEQSTENNASSGIVPQSTPKRSSTYASDDLGRRYAVQGQLEGSTIAEALPSSRISPGPLDMNELENGGTERIRENSAVDAASQREADVLQHVLGSRAPARRCGAAGILGGGSFRGGGVGRGDEAEVISLKATVAALNASLQSYQADFHRVQVELAEEKEASHALERVLAMTKGGNGVGEGKMAATESLQTQTTACAIGNSQDQYAQPLADMGYDIDRVTLIKFSNVSDHLANFHSGLAAMRSCVSSLDLRLRDSHQRVSAMHELLQSAVQLLHEFKRLYERPTKEITASSGAAGLLVKTDQLLRSAQSYQHDESSSVSSSAVPRDINELRMQRECVGDLSVLDARTFARNAAVSPENQSDLNDCARWGTAMERAVEALEELLPGLIPLASGAAAKVDGDIKAKVSSSSEHVAQPLGPVQGVPATADFKMTRNCFKLMMESFDAAMDILSSLEADIEDWITSKSKKGSNEDRANGEVLSWPPHQALSHERLQDSKRLSSSDEKIAWLGSELLLRLKSMASFFNRAKNYIDRSSPVDLRKHPDNAAHANDGRVAGCDGDSCDQELCNESGSESEDIDGLREALLVEKEWARRREEQLLQEIEDLKRQVQRLGTNQPRRPSQNNTDDGIDEATKENVRSTAQEWPHISVEDYRADLDAWKSAVDRLQTLLEEERAANQIYMTQTEEALRQAQIAASDAAMLEETLDVAANAPLLQDLLAALAAHQSPPLRSGAGNSAQKPPYGKAGDPFAEMADTRGTFKTLFGSPVAVSTQTVDEVLEQNGIRGAEDRNDVIRQLNSINLATSTVQDLPPCGNATEDNRNQRDNDTSLKTSCDDHCNHRTDFDIDWQVDSCNSDSNTGIVGNVNAEEGVGADEEDALPILTPSPTNASSHGAGFRGSGTAHSRTAIRSTSTMSDDVQEEFGRVSYSSAEKVHRDSWTVDDPSDNDSDDSLWELGFLEEQAVLRRLRDVRKHAFTSSDDESKRRAGGTIIAVNGADVKNVSPEVLIRQLTCDEGDSTLDSWAVVRVMSPQGGHVWDLPLRRSVIRYVTNSANDGKSNLDGTARNARAAKRDSSDRVDAVAVSGKICSGGLWEIERVESDAASYVASVSTLEFQDLEAKLQSVWPAPGLGPCEVVIKVQLRRDLPEFRRKKACLGLLQAVTSHMPITGASMTGATKSANGLCILSLKSAAKAAEPETSIVKSISAQASMPVKVSDHPENSTQRASAERAKISSKPVYGERAPRASQSHLLTTAAKKLKNRTERSGTEKTVGRSLISSPHTYDVSADYPTNASINLTAQGKAERRGQGTGQISAAGEIRDVDCSVSWEEAKRRIAITFQDEILAAKAREEHLSKEINQARRDAEAKKLLIGLYKQRIFTAENAAASLRVELLRASAAAQTTARTVRGR